MLSHVLRVLARIAPIITTISDMIKGVENPCQKAIVSNPAVSLMLVAACAKNDWLNVLGMSPMIMTPITRITGETNIPIGASFGDTGNAALSDFFRPNTPKNKYIE